MNTKIDVTGICSHHCNNTNFHRDDNFYHGDENNYHGDENNYHCDDNFYVRGYNYLSSRFIVFIPMKTLFDPRGKCKYIGILGMTICHCLLPFSGPAETEDSESRLVIPFYNYIRVIRETF